MTLTTERSWVWRCQILDALLENGKKTKMANKCTSKIGQKKLRTLKYFRNTETK